MARIIDVCDALVTEVYDHWLTTYGPPIFPSEVKRSYVAPANLDRLQGRRVWVFPATWNQETSSRGLPDDPANSINDYAVVLVIAERYAGEGAGDPIDSDTARGWIDERVEFAQSIYDLVSDFGKPVMLQVDGRRPIFCESAEPVDVYDEATLSQDKCFWCRMGFTLREVE